MPLLYISPQEQLLRSLRFLGAVFCAALCLFPAYLSAQLVEWRTLGNLQQSRHQFHAFPLSNSQILVLGGFTNSSCVLCGTPTRNCEIIDVQRRSVNAAATMNIAHADAAALMAADSSIVVISGVVSGSGDLTPIVEVFNKQTNTWRIAGSLLYARRQHTAIFISQDEILVVGGRERNLLSLAAAEVFNIRTGTSRRVSDFPYPMNLGISTTSSKGDILVGYGRSGGEGSFRSTTIYKFDIGSSSWQTLADLPLALVTPAIAKTPDGRVVFINGSQSEGNPPNQVSNKAFIEQGSGFPELATLNTGRAWSKAAQWSADSVLIVGGYNSGVRALNTTEWLNIRTGRASPAPSMRDTRMFTQTVSLPGCIVAVAGLSDARIGLSSIEILQRVSDSLTVPSIASFTPTRGTTGTTVVITGAGFIGTTAVSFGGIPAASFRVDAPTQITAVVRAGASGAVRVVNALGIAEKSGFVFAVPMQVTTIAGGMGRAIIHIAQDEQKNFYIPAQDQGKIYRVTPSGEVSTFFSVPAASCTFIGGIARDRAGNFYVTYSCDKGIILKISPDGLQSSTFYQNAALGTVYSIEFDGEGYLWGVSADKKIVFKISPSGVMNIVYQGEPLSVASALKLDGRGNIYLANYASNTVLKINSCNVATVIYQGPLVQNPNGLVIGQSGNLYVTSYDAVSNGSAHRLIKITPSGEASVFVGAGTQGHKDGSLLDAQFSGITGLLFDPSGDMYVTDYYSGYLRKISNVGELPLNTNVQLYAGPQFTDFSPTSGTSGTVVTLRGIGLGCVKEVSFGGVAAASFRIVSDNEIQAIVGVGATGAIRVVAPSGSASREVFTFLSQPVITALSPSQLIPGATVIITGRNFLGATSVQFGSVEATIFTVNSDSRITALVPPNVTGSTVRVQTPGGVALYNAPSPALAPIITRLSDSTATLGDTVQIYGRSFTGATDVRFGSTTTSVKAISFRVVSDSLIIAVVGNGASGSVLVTTPAGTAIWNGFRYIEAPTVLARLGYGLYHPVLDSKGNLFIVQENIGLQRITPNGAVSLFYRSPVGVCFAGLTIDRNDNLFVADSNGRRIVRISSEGKVVVVSSSPLLRGVYGLDIDNSGTLYASSYENNTVLSIAPDGSTTTIYSGGLLNKPAHLRLDKDGNIIVPNDVNNGVVVKIHPCNGTASVVYQGGQIVRSNSVLPTADGSLFIGDYLGNKVMLVSSKGVSAEGSLDTYIAPQAPSPRNFAIDQPLGMNVSTDGTLYAVEYRTGKIWRIPKTDNRPVNTAAISFTPQIGSFSPTTGTVGQVVSIRGTRFSCGVSRLTVGGIPAREYTVVSDSLIIATVSTGATGAVSITTPLGIASRERFVFLSATTPTVAVTTPTVTTPTVTLVPPSIFTFTPIQGTSGTLISIIGRGFTGVTNVQFGSATNATPAASFLVRSDSLIAATLGVGATGNVTVISTTGIATRSGFVYLVPTLSTTIPTVTPPIITPPRTDSTTAPPPTITSIAPQCAAGTNILTIVGTGFTGRPEIRFGRLASGTTLSRLQLAPSFSVVSTTVIVAVLPSGLATFAGLRSGSADFGISISTTTGTATRSGLQYVESAPTITAFTPSVATEGDKLFIVGQGFYCVRDVRVGGAAASSYQVVSDTLIIATLARTTNGTVSVATPAGIAERSGFVYAQFPTALLPNITSFSPTAARAGQTITITGTNFSGTNPNGSAFTTTSVSLGGIPVAFTVVSPTQITVRIPNDFFTTGTDVRLSTPGGSVSAQGFTFIPEPIITSFGPERASTGTVVLISGRNFTGATSVQFGGAPAQAFTVLADTLISAVVGDGASGEVRVATQNGSATKSGFTFVIPPPFITSFTPTLFAASTTVTITGRNFVGNGYTTQLVLIGNNAASILSVNPTVLVVRAPAMVSSTGISVITPGGSANACCLTLPQTMMPMLPQPPRISGFSPALSGVGGTVTVRGENFTGATDVRFGGVAAASFRVISATEIQAVVGAGATGEVSVRTPAGSASFSGFTFVLPPQPIITGFSPSTGAAGDTVRVRGQYLQTVSAFSIVGDPNITVNATFTTSGDTLVTAVLGAGQSFSLGTINLRTLGGTARATGFSFIAAPVITSFSPTIAGLGDAVVINGAGFDNVQSVSFGNPPTLVPAASYVVNSPSRITASLGAGATGSVVVVTRGGNASRPGFMYAPVPVITRFVPDSARAGETVRITGSGFIAQAAVSTVSFGGVRAASFTVVSDSVITAIPAQIGATGSISLTTPGGTAQRSGFVFLAPLPTITSFSPQQASVGDIVTINGTNLNGATSVSFGGRSAASFLVSSPTQIVARVSNGTSGTVAVQTPGGRATAPNFIFIPAPPVVTSFSPDSAGASQTITLRGSDFSGVTAVRFTTSGGTTAAAQSFSITNDSTMTVRVPVLGTSRITATITVQSPNGAGSREGLRFVPAPAIASFTPASATAGTTIVITGTNLSAATAVRFGGTSARSFTVNSDTQLTAVVGSGASGAVSVVTYGGTASRDGFTFQAEQVVIPAPTIASFAPQEAAANATVTITGTNFSGSGLSGISGVQFGGVAAQSYAVQSPTTITAVVGAGASGAITVSSARGTASLAGFRFIPAPVITDFTPKSAGRGATVSITGRNLAGATSVSFGGTAVQFAIVGDTLIRATVQIGSTGAISVTTPGGTATAQGFTFLSGFAAFDPKGSSALTDTRLQATTAQGFVRVYPNPVSDMLTIEAAPECAVQPLRLTFLNTLGVVVMTLDAQSTGEVFRKEVSVAHLAAGAYSVEMVCGGQRLVARFVRF